MKTCELTGAALDWAVAMCWFGDEYDMSIPLFDDGLLFAPSTNWSHGGPIIEREQIDVMWCGDRWCAYAMTPDMETQLMDEGPTPLIAAMRCYVASKCGESVNVPEELA